MYGQQVFPGQYGIPYQNPMMNAQQRLAQMEQQYPQFAQQQPAQQQVAWMKCRAVTSLDEAKAAMIDLDGSLNVFTNIANGEIYTKQVGLDGLAVFHTYRLVNPAAQAQSIQQQQSTSNFGNENGVLRGEFVEAINTLQQQINALNSKFEEKGGTVNGKPNAAVIPTTDTNGNAANGRSARK